ncbi:extended synaptotagmin-2-A [Nematolebias whitei]|uniref:extended synaptotagmin-2-A n=1 Tax=Nematolebias whitei TaxID=451745 RepID=UPI001897073E|nr:extended synaptotagmin-2-A [Nematolebias whitei]
MSGDSMTAVRGAHSNSASSASPKENGQPAQPNFPHPSSVSAADACPTSELTHTWVHFVKTFVLIFPIYVLGYFEFSFSWLLIGLFIFFCWRRSTGGKRTRLSRALAFFDQEEERSAKQGLTTSDLPPWVHFPDVERVEWINKTVRQMWPYICQFVEKLFREVIEPAVKESHTQLSTFCFSKIDIGNKPLRINGVKVYTENVDRRQIIMDLQISFVGNTEIDVDIKRYYCKAGIKSIQIHGVLRLVMEPLLGDMPLVGALSLFFLKKPLLDINWTGLTNILDIPGLNGFSNSLIQDVIYSYLVLPNRVTIPLVGEEKLAKLRFPMPKGVLRIHFLEAQDLEGKDHFLGGLIKGKSDPYGVLQIGNQLFHSKTIKESLHPKWNEVYEALLYEPSGQHLEIELFDEDPDKDDFLGSLMIDLTELHKEQKVDEILSLEKQTSSDLPSSVQVRKSSVPHPASVPSLSLSPSESPPPSATPPQPVHASTLTLHDPDGEPYSASPRRSTSNLSTCMSSSQKHLPHRDSTPSLASDISLPTATLELQQRLHQLQNGSAPNQYSLGEIQLTVRHSCQRNKLVVVVHACRNLIAFTKDGSDPFIRLYLLPDKSRTGRRRTNTLKKTLNPIYDQTFEFSVSMVELHRRTLDVAVKNGRSILSKHKGLLGKVLVDLSGDDVSKGLTQWYDLSEDGLSSQSFRRSQESLIT